MSAVFAPAVERQQSRQTAPKRTRHLRIAPQPPQLGMTTMRWVIIVVGLLGAVGVGQLIMNIAISQGAYELQSLESEQVQLDRQETALQEEVSVLASPQNLAANATGLGMVPGDNASYLDVSTGQITGPGESSGWGASIDPTLVSNEALSPSAPNLANPGFVPPETDDDGVSTEGDAQADIPSVSELPAPDTR